MRLSWASETMDCMRFKRSVASLSVGVSCVDFKRGGRIRGERPNHSWKGVKPVERLTVFIISNLIFGRALTQPI